MNKSKIIEPTKFLSLDDNVTKLEVDSLPKEIRFEIETLDHIAQQKMNALCQLEILELAFHAQKMKISGLLKNLHSTSETITKEKN